MITLSLLLFPAFSQKMRTQTFVCSSLHPSLPDSSVLSESAPHKCFSASQTKDKREKKYSNGLRQRKVERKTQKEK